MAAVISAASSMAWSADNNAELDRDLNLSLMDDCVLFNDHGCGIATADSAERENEEITELDSSMANIFELFRPSRILPC